MKGMHHFYIGLAIILISFFLIWKDVSTTMVLIIFWIGSVILLDDFHQHMRQRTEPKYYSPLHRLYGWFYSRSKILRWLNRIADKLFGIEDKDENK